MCIALAIIRPNSVPAPWSTFAPAEPRALKKSLVLSAYYVAPPFGAVRCGDARRRSLDQALLQRDHADAAQMRGEIRHVPPHQQNFVVQCGDEGRNGQALAGGDLLEDVPEFPFEADARALPVEPDRTRFIDVAVWVLAGKQMAHAFLPFPPVMLSALIQFEDFSVTAQAATPSRTAGGRPALLRRVGSLLVKAGRFAPRDLR